PGRRRRRSGSHRRTGVWLSVFHAQFRFAPLAARHHATAPLRPPARKRKGRADSCLFRRLFADVRRQGAEAGPLYGRLYGPLEGRAVAAALAAEQLPLTGAELLEALHVLVVHERRPRTAFLGAEPAAVFAPSPELLADHRCPRPQCLSVSMRARYGETIKV